MFYSRKILPFLKQHLKKRPITVITGMRRTGKTTLVKRLLDLAPAKNKIYLDLELQSNQDIFAPRNYDEIIQTLRRRGLTFEQKVYIAIDEIQLVQNIPSILKYLYDNFDIKFIVTGSSSYYMKNLFAESLAGRKKIFELYPLDFGEFLDFKEFPRARANNWQSKFNVAEYERIRMYYEEYVEFGGFPEVVLAKIAADKKELLDDIISSYIKIDVATLSDFHDRQNVYDIIKMLASRVSNKIDFSKLSRLSGISRTMARNYLGLFTDTYLVAQVPVYTRNRDREIVKAKKLYFCDNGLLSFLADVGSGAKFENAVFNQLRHNGQISYFSLKNGREIDFVLDEKIAFEAKETPTQTDLTNLKNLAKTAGLRKHRLIGRRRSPVFSDYMWGGEIV
ncbi:ATP-binding protein [Patescibacteria group bacterium]|nr:MAG: ATP-binding protein [Patescibacteria group bacterium]